MSWLKAKLNLNFLLWLLFYATIFTFVLNISFHYFDHDFPWHLRIGKQINDEMAVPTVDYYNHTMQGETYIDHEWLFNWIFYRLYDSCGYIALNIMFATIITLTIFLLKIITKKFFIKKYHEANTEYPSPMFITMIISAYGALSITPFYGARMQILGNLLFLIMLLLLYYFKEYKLKKYLLFLIPLFILWANLHGSFLIGLAIMWGFFLCQATVSIISKFKINIFEENNFSLKDFKFSFAIAVIASLSTLINPYGLGLYSFLSGYKNTYYMTAILEWRPLYYLPIYYHQIILMSIFFAVLILTIIFFRNNNTKQFGIKKFIQKIDLWKWSLALLFLILAFKSKRHFPLFFIVAFPLIIQFIYFELIIEIKNNISKYSLMIKKSLIFIFLVSSIYFLWDTNFTNEPFNKNYSPSMPYDMISFLKDVDNLKEKKVFNDYSWGGFFLWTLPQMKIFIDGRMPQANFEDRTLIEEYMDFFEEGKSEELIKKHQIDLIILQKELPVNINKFEEKFFKLNKEEINSIPNHLENYLKNNLEWEIVYEDGLGVVYLKK